MKVTALVYRTDGTWSLEIKELPDWWFNIFSNESQDSEQSEEQK